MSEWKKVKLGDICNFVKGEIGIAKAQAGEYPLVVTGKERKTCDFFQFDTKAVCIPLVSSAGHGKAALNYVHYQEGKFALGSILVAVIPQDENVINAQFLHLYLSRLKDLLLVPLMKGTANVSLSVALIKNIEISLPKIEKQIEIVSLFNQIDLDHQELTKENTNQKIYLTKLRQAILQEAIEGKLTADWRVKNPVCLGDPNTDAAALLATIKAEKQKLIADGKIKKEKPLAPINSDDVPFTLPDGWVWVRLGNVCSKITDGTHHSPINVSSGKYKYITAKNIKNDGIDLSNVTYVDTNFHEEIYKRCNPEFGDILYIKDGATTGIVTVNNLTEQFSMLSSVALLKPLFLNFFLMYAMRSPTFYNATRDNMAGVAITRVTLAKIINAIIPLPPLAEQQAIVNRVDRLLNTVTELEQQTQQRKTHAQQLMQAVLKEAFTQKTQD